MLTDEGILLPGDKLQHRLRTKDENGRWSHIELTFERVQREEGQPHVLLCRGPDNKPWGISETDFALWRKKPPARPMPSPEGLQAFWKIVNANVDNDVLTDATFRQFVRKSL